MLLLFDIDGTLISTNGAGISAMVDAGRELHGPEFSADGIPFAGRLDPLIIADMLAAKGIAPSARAIADLRAAYERHLRARLTRDRSRCTALPGVFALLDALAPREDVTLGLLTGNFAETGSLKLRACGIDPDRFSIRVWGDDSPHHPPRREHLPPVGMSRFAEIRGRIIDPRRVWIIGDTPHDVSCAREHGCRCLAVATGRHAAAELEHVGATHVSPTLLPTESILDVLLRAGD